MAINKYSMIMRFVIGVLGILLSTGSFSQGQNAKLLTLGDKVPDLELKYVINSPKSSIRLSEFRGKFLILDFWAPWCVPCVAAFPKLDSLRTKNAGKLEILHVTSEDKTSSEQLLKRLKETKKIKSTTSVVEDSVLTKLFYPQGIPYYIWIDSAGSIKAITGTEKITQENINRFFAGEELNISRNTSRLKLDLERPFFTDQYLPGDATLYHSTLTRFIPGLSASASSRKNWIRCINHSIKGLYQIALGEFDLSYLGMERTVLEGFKTQMDSLSVGFYDSSARKIWKERARNYVYNYELVVGDSTVGRRQLCSLMLQDLNRMFGPKGITGKLETRKRKVVALIRSSGVDKIKSKGGEPKDASSVLAIDIRNKRISALLTRLKIILGGKTHPLVNDTQYKGYVDIHIDVDDGNLNIDLLNKLLDKYDLKLVEKEVEIKMVVLTKSEI